MKKKLLCTLLVTTISLALLACGTTEENKDTETNKNDSSLGDVEVEENLFSVELTIPADYVGETTQEELNKTAEEEGYKSITLNDDGSATYLMTKDQHKKMMSEIADNIKSGLQEMVTSGDYPTFTAVEANSDFTTFTVTTTSSKLNMVESISVMTLYTYGGMYHVFNGTTVDNIHVDFVNAETDKIISSSDSSKSK